ncbi:winged helix DNA-binding domain-containing protein [Nocardioides mangrovicus]|uniref:Winged helix DNA-binding domain-containing protein n=1 Tax=Nocardioides mangrovicus TaxID=2478913 RepID=A0A3L8P2F3_9ACTN|nr:winged helix DNA-binding domain-containing protein [Nocardioides mangrovicus]RLV49586.1 winged helix DNA-binding domain-containing protein [Nocardioides mangrovicus]
MQLTARALDRTLLLRQHLLERTDVEPLAMVEHLVGLQAQEPLPPYLSLAARVAGFDPLALSAHLERREAVRLLTMRGTIHLLAPADALALRPWVQPFLDRQLRSDRQARPAAHLAREELAAAANAHVPVPAAELRERFTAAFPETSADATLQAARSRLPLVQAPPRGLWQRAGGVSYVDVEHWLGAPQTEIDLPTLVRRWLRAYGPATASDLTTWSGVTRLGPVLADLVLTRHTGPDGAVLLDVPDAPIAEEDTAAPARLLGRYDNLWLSHTKRDRVLAGEDRKRWMGTNGGVGQLVLLDGAGAGFWRLEKGRVVLDLWREPTRSEREELAEEVERVERLLAVR